MTRKEAIKVLNKDLQIIDDPNVTMTAREWEEHDDNMRDALEMAIQVLEQEPKWIPVTESLPEEGLTVLIFAEGGEIEFGQRYENKWEWLAESIADYWTEAEEVIAWQPLPEPYEEADE